MPGSLLVKYISDYELDAYIKLQDMEIKRPVTFQLQAKLKYLIHEFLARLFEEHGELLQYPRCERENVKVCV